MLITTADVHMELERDLASFLTVPAAIIYSHSFSTISSVIPSFSKRGDIIVADRGVNFAIQKGIQISRSTVKWYDHGDYAGLERVLEGIKAEDKRYGRKPTASRRFIITEGVFENDGSMVDLPKVVSRNFSLAVRRADDRAVQMELKLKYKYRLILDEAWSFGVVGKTGRGVTEVYNIPAAQIDIMTGSMAIGLCSAGGFCVGSLDVVAHQVGRVYSFTRMELTLHCDSASTLPRSSSLPPSLPSSPCRHRNRSPSSRSPSLQRIPLTLSPRSPNPPGLCERSSTRFTRSTFLPTPPRRSFTFTSNERPFRLRQARQQSLERRRQCRR